MLPPSPQMRYDRFHDEQGKELWSGNAAHFAALDEALLDGIAQSAKCNCGATRGPMGLYHGPRCQALVNYPEFYRHCSGCAAVSLSFDIAWLDGWRGGQCPACQDMGGITCC